MDFVVEGTPRQETRGSLDTDHTNIQYTQVLAPNVCKSSTSCLSLFLYIWRVQKITMSTEDLDETECLVEMRWWRFGR